MPRDTGSADTEQQNELVSGTHQSKMRPANHLSLDKAALQGLPRHKQTLQIVINSFSSEPDRKTLL